MYHRIREIRAKEGGKPIFTIDFQDDVESLCKKCKNYSAKWVEKAEGL